MNQLVKKTQGFENVMLLTKDDSKVMTTMGMSL